ncbi:ZIP family metal transporter [Laspinema olomoucense]|uniref:Zinc/iron permease n=1 Tax=Laspinema olomoucense D3b TaxID=2953688 RepID=A0ABT2NEY5_9CYAN|nr:zinc/iron permease [Laspinema sp. D3b]MCT7981268.1 zinc/iron permease [Laspinema sp. D3b]
MNPYLSTLALSAMPAIGSYIGGLLAEFIPPSKSNLSLTLHAAAGIILSVVGVEIMPEMLAADPPWLIFLAFVGGGGFFILMRRAIKFFQKRSKNSETQSSSAWVISVGVGIDLFSDGLMVGTSSTIAFSLAVMVALGHVLANIPTGMAAISSFKQGKTSALFRQILSASFIFPPVIGATLGYWVVVGQPEVIKFMLLAFTAGILTTLVVENMVPEASEYEKENYQETLCFVGVFAFVALLSTYLG